VYFFTVLIALENHIIKIPFGSNQLGFFMIINFFPTIDPIDIPKNLWVIKISRHKT
jgi:hypothetical protein